MTNVRYETVSVCASNDIDFMWGTWGRRELKGIFASLCGGE